MGLLDFLGIKPKERSVIKEYISNVIGTDYTNGDGSSRQEYIKTLKIGDELFFKPAPVKDYPDSIGVFTKKGKQIGVVNYKVLNEMRQNYARNSASVEVADVGYYNESYFCSMRIKIYG